MLNFNAIKLTPTAQVEGQLKKRRRMGCVHIDRGTEIKSVIVEFQ